MGKTGRPGLFLLLTACLAAGAPPLSARPVPTAGARALALGNAYTAEKEDVNALFFNPAGLTGLTGPQLTASYGRLDLGGASVITEGHGAFGKPYRFRGLPVGVAGGFMAQSIASGVHQFDLYTGAGMDVPTRGFVPWPVRGGAVFKIRSQNGGKINSSVGKTKAGFGVDGGLRVEFLENFAAGLALRDLYLSGLNPPGPQLRLGVRYFHKHQVLLLSDVEIRKASSLHLGAEWYLYRDLLRLRLWNAFSANGVDHMAVGAGFNFSPLQFDVAYLIPMKTFNDRSNQARLTLIYRFNAPKFTEIYFDRALDQAEALDRRVTSLQERENTLKTSLQDLEQARRLAEEDLARQSVRRSEGLKATDEELLKARTRAADAEKRARELEEKVRAAEDTIRRAEGIRRSAAPKPVETGPKIRTHTVQPGETLRGLAERYYKDADRWETIYNANKDKVDRGRPIPGVTLVIPE